MKNLINFFKFMVFSKKLHMAQSLFVLLLIRDIDILENLIKLHIDIL